MFERHLLSLSPEQAAAEISELAGLSQVPDDEAPAPAILPERF
jgi:hypothetical protein